MSRVPDPLTVGRVIGEVVDNFTPSVQMDVTYNTNKQLANGHELMPPVIAARPRVNIGGDDLRAAFTLIMTDLDAPSPSNPFLREHLLWMVTDIPGITDASFGENAFEVISSLQPPPATVNSALSSAGGHCFFSLWRRELRAFEALSPLTRMVTDIPGITDASFGKEVVSYESPNPAVGIHRYIFVLFKQLGRRAVSPPSSRDYFNTRRFSIENGLGLPVEAVYFNAHRETAARRK
ncbi:putative Leucine-rich repeat transmembrane protein kinase [Hibiscus syriacus]|uniref:Leucine-rich repeat transmembrane protein kinase n=1 Tax=Hibiscus syriacus TaxID=106335 RepID=A0A6A2ZSV9_HIBSY|nr:putative Leucine-rich repeat transmembrane protein kinase [Hibiscus syriacus]